MIDLPLHTTSTFLKTDAVCLRIIPFSRTSHIVSWITPERGLLRTIVKGACRPKSLFLGQYDLFQTCEIVVYARERNGLHVLKEACGIDVRSAFRVHWRGAALASYVCDLVRRNLLGNEHAPGCYELLVETLDTLLLKGAGLPLTFWFELKLARAMGLAPSLTRCTGCRRSLDPPGTFLFSSRQGGLVCPTCAAAAGDAPIRIFPDQLSILRHLQRTPSARAAANIRCSHKQCLAISGMVGTFMAFHLETNPAARKAAMGLSTRKDASVGWGGG